MAIPDLSPNTLPINELGRFLSRHADLPIGTVFGRLTVVGDERRVDKNYVVTCRCDCGREIVSRVDSLIRGKKLQCGGHSRIVTEAMRQALSLRSRTHGRSGTSEYNSWVGMKMRCFNQKDGRYADYGGRGITVASEWIDDFEAFFAFIGPKPSPAHSLDRIDNDGDYKPGNVRWADKYQQAKNKRPYLMVPGAGKRRRSPPSQSTRNHRALTKPKRGHHNCRHGYSGSSEYDAWRHMIARCHNPRHKAFCNYGGRGIEVCAEWRESFEAFLASVGPKPDPTLSLDRIDHDGNYDPGNVRWADASTQNRNRRPFMIVPGSRLR